MSLKPIVLRRVFWHVAVILQSEYSDCHYEFGEDDYPTSRTVYGVITRLDAFRVVRSGLPNREELYVHDEEG